MSFIRRLLSRLNISFTTEESAPATAQISALEALREVARRGEVARVIPDPSAWQQETRQDRDLPFHG
ncbi:MAG: hypothetical protein SF053_10485 [Bacteroidia bacterium]|nr:hypothetical protein [Bacteroidia bacterium]